jgi:hypothetical protein
VDWFNPRRLLEPIGHVPPAEFEVTSRHKEDPAALPDSRTQASGQPGAVCYDRVHEVWEAIEAKPDEYVALKVDSGRLLSESPQRVGLYPAGRASAHRVGGGGEGRVLWE